MNTRTPLPIIEYDLRRRLACFELCAHFLNLRGLLFELRRQHRNSFLLPMTAQLKIKAATHGNRDGFATCRGGAERCRYLSYSVQFSTANTAVSFAKSARARKMSFASSARDNFAAPLAAGPIVFTRTMESVL
jgi:hypothetical protein